MPAPAVGMSERSIGSLLRDLAEGSAHLLRQEWELVRLELYHLAKGIGIGVALTAASGVCLVLGTISILIGTLLALADPWIQTHVVTVISIGTALLIFVVAWLVKAGIRTLVETDFTGEKQPESRQWRDLPPKFAATSS